MTYQWDFAVVWRSAHLLLWGLGNTLKVTNGDTTSYSGSVGAIPPEKFVPPNPYQWGMFTYVETDAASGQQFEVVNYWVE